MDSKPADNSATPSIDPALLTLAAGREANHLIEPGDGVLGYWDHNGDARGGLGAIPIFFSGLLVELGLAAGGHRA
jgi:hypothetical protein